MPEVGIGISEVRPRNYGKFIIKKNIHLFGGTKLSALFRFHIPLTIFIRSDLNGIKPGFYHIYVFSKNKLKSTDNRVTRSTDNRVTRSTDNRVIRSTEKRVTRLTDKRVTRSTDNRETRSTEGLGQVMLYKNKIK